MNWKPRVAWAALAILTACVAWLLTRTVTRVHYGATAHLSVAFDERPPVAIAVSHLDLPFLKSSRYRIPAIVLLGRGAVLFLVGPTTRAILITTPDDGSIACAMVRGTFDSAAPLAIVQRVTAGASLEPLAPTLVTGRTVRLSIPPRLHDELRRAANSQGAIQCSVQSELATPLTFTERALTLTGNNGGGALLVDAESLEDVDNVRFSGGIAVPLAGERVRLLTAADHTLSMEWIDVAAQEQHDIVLVFVGGLAAIAAAMAIEAVRPFIER